MRRIASRSVVLTLVATIVLIAGGCRRAPDIGAEGRLVPSGNVLLTGRGGDPVSVTKQRSLRAGDLVEVSDGSATVMLPSGATLELRPRAIVVFDRGPELRGGDLLVTAPQTTQVVRSAGSEVRAAGATRLTLSLSLRVSSYAGVAKVDSGGRSIDVPALRQVGVPALGVVPGAPSPLALSRDDVWDKRFLGDVINATDGLEALGRGFSEQVVNEGKTAGFYRFLIPALDAESAFQQAFVDQARDPGDVLIGSTIAIVGKRGAFADRLAGVATFRAEGAQWALVAKDQQVPSFDALRQAIEAAIGRAPLQLTAPPTVTVPTVPATHKRATPTKPGSPAEPTTAPPASPPPSAPPPGTPPTEPPPPQNPGALQPIIDPVVALLNGLLAPK